MVVAWELYASSEQAWEAMLDSCKRAKKTIDFEQFTLKGFDEGEIGKQFVDIFIAKAQQGVKVRLLLDAVGSFAFSVSKHKKDLVQAGVDIHFHRVTFFWEGKFVPKFFLRDHRKLLTVDGKECFVGGVIINERGRGWRDTSIRCEGDIAYVFQDAFDNLWCKLNGKNKTNSLIRALSTDFFLITDGPFRYLRHMYRIYLNHIAQAKKTIFLTSSYFAPDRRFVNALVAAAQRGVDVRVMTSGKSDYATSQYVSRVHYARLMSAGVKVFEYTKSHIHSKVMTIDNKWSVVGSSNLDYLSMWLNYEINLISKDKQFISLLNRQFNRDQKQSVNIDAHTWPMRPFSEKIKEQLAGMFRRII